MFAVIIMREKEMPVPFRLPESWLTALRDLRSVTGISVQQILEDATALHLGKPDPTARERREHVVKAVRTGKVSSPFDSARDRFSLMTASR